MGTGSTVAPDHNHVTRDTPDHQGALRPNHAALYPLNRLTAPITDSAAKSTSSSVVNRPSPNLKLALAISSSTPIASNTWLGSGFAAVQADPELTHTSLMAIINASPSTSRKLTFKFPGSLSSRWPFTTTSSRPSRIRVCNRSLNPRIRSASASLSLKAISAAFPNPTINGTGNVPDRIPRS